jgi:hypothetical protein
MFLSFLWLLRKEIGMITEQLSQKAINWLSSIGSECAFTLSTTITLLVFPLLDYFQAFFTYFYLIGDLIYQILMN